ncbi:MAG TPA: hypothetical protein PJ994_10950 [Tepidiformaceae bacterium]|nr:hypothetical protein [Tepidiformaceae bacterium]HMO96193.1 hypothetical protein [Tepidiformaceae bacterium]
MPWKQQMLVRSASRSPGVGSPSPPRSPNGDESEQLKRVTALIEALG